MTDAASSARPLRTTLIAGGVLLIVHAVATFARPSFFAMPFSIAVSWVGILAFSAAVIVFAFGVGLEGSIVARGALALTAAVVVAVWPLVERTLSLLLPYERADPAFYPIWGYVSWAVMLAALLILVVRIARAGVLRGRVRWMPLWGLILIVAPQVLAQLLVVALSVDFGTDDQEWIFLVYGLGQLVAFAVPLGLGIIALLVANRPTAAVGGVQVYPPSD